MCNICKNMFKSSHSSNEEVSIKSKVSSKMDVSAPKSELISYIKSLEREFNQGQKALLKLSSQLGRIQFRIRQLMEANPIDRAIIIEDLVRIAFEGDAYSQCKPEELPAIEDDFERMGNVKDKQILMCCQLRAMIANLQIETAFLPTEYRCVQNKKDEESERKEKVSNYETVVGMENHCGEFSKSSSKIITKTGSKSSIKDSSKSTKNSGHSISIKESKT